MKDMANVTIGKTERRWFHGHTVIQLFDAKTGKETDRIEHDNRFTLAVDELINKMPYAMGCNYAAKTISKGTEEQMLPLSEYALGGILLYPAAINASQEVDDPLYCFDQNPTGYASREAYSGEDTKRGNFNAVESGTIQSGTGYRFVYDFSTSQANGTITAVCLTSRDGGKNEFGIDAEPYFYKGIAANSSYSYRPVLVTDEGLYHLVLSGSDVLVYFVSWGMYKLGINDNYPLSIPSNEFGTLVHTFEGVSSYNFNFAACGTEILIVKIAEGSNKLNIIKYDVDTDTETTLSEIDVYSAASLYLNRGETHSVGYDGTNVYVLGNSLNQNLNRNIVRVNLSTPVDSELIETGSNVALYAFAWEGNYLSGQRVMYFPSKSAQIFTRSDKPFAIGRRGVYNIYSGGFNDTFVSAGMLSPYLGTINNLSQAVTKTADKSMKITYEITPANEE